jgi:hypothetical protein
MTQPILHRQEVIEGTDAYNVGAITIPRAGFQNGVLLTQADVTGSITLNVYLPASSTVLYTTAFSKTLIQDGTLEAIHAATVDKDWPDAIGHNFQHQIRAADLAAYVTPLVLKGGRSYTFEYLIPTLRDGTVPAIFVWDITPRH